MENEEENITSSVNSSNWDFETELDLLKTRLLLKSTGNECKKVRGLIATCISLTQDFVSQSSDTQQESGQVTDPSNVSGSGGSRINPLDIPLNIQEILNYLPRKYLFNLRLINHSWNAMALYWIQKKSYERVVIKSKDFPRFCADMEEAEGLPLRKLSIKLEGLSRDHCSNFFTKHGSGLRNLEIKEKDWRINNRNCTRMSILQNLKKMQTILKLVPNLTGLTLVLDGIPKVVPEKFIFDEEELPKVILTQVEWLGVRSFDPLGEGFLKGLFAMLPNVKTINCDGLVDEDQDWEVFVAAIRGLSVHTINGPCSPLSSEPSVIDFCRALMAQDSLRLKDISVGVHLKTYSEHTAQLLDAQTDLLRSKSESLEGLTVFVGETIREWDRNEQRLCLPILPNLKSITFTPRDDGTALAPIQPEQIPNLRALYNVGPEHLTLSYGSRVFGDYVYSSIRELHFTSWRVYLTPEIMESLVTKFPNIADLEIKFMYAGLENFNLDISGIPVGSEWALTQLADRIGFTALPSWIDTPGKSLRDFRCLKRLSIEFVSPKTPVRIDEFGVYMTFLRLSPNLHLTLRGDLSISDDLAAKLKAHYRNIVLQPSADLTT